VISVTDLVIAYLPKSQNGLISTPPPFPMTRTDAHPPHSPVNASLLPSHISEKLTNHKNYTWTNFPGKQNLFSQQWATKPSCLSEHFEVPNPN
jgi:hypothetical protein